MWSLFDRLLQILLLVASAAAIFVVGAVVASVARDEPSELAPAPANPLVEVRLSSPGEGSEVFVGQPLIVHVELVNLQARRVERQVPFDPTGDTAADDLMLDRDGIPWELRLALQVAADGVVAIDRVDPRRHLLDPDPVAAGRRLGLTPARTTFILEGPELARIPPGPLEINATLPVDLVPPDRVRVMPLRLDLRPTPTNDPDRAAINLAVARVAALREESATAIEAGLTALALDPLRDEALRIIAESWEQQGDVDRALEWYGRYLETIPDSAADERAALEVYVDALRRRR